MAVLEFHFAPKPVDPPRFDYAAFRAEYSRRKRQTEYERIRENADRQPKQLPLWTAEGKPFWAAFQVEPGLGVSNLIHNWQRERYIDPDDGKVRYTQSALDLVRHPVVEPSALAVIEHEAQIYAATGGRTFLTPDEDWILGLSKRYLREADHMEHRRKYYPYEPKYRRDGSLHEDLMFNWIASVTGYTPDKVESLLNASENVFLMRAALGLEAQPDVKQVERRQETSVAKAA